MSKHPKNKNLEQILVVPAVRLFDNINRWNGLWFGAPDEFERQVKSFGRFEMRGLMETNEQYKQLIPYIVLRHQDHIFVMQRRDDATETRLRSKMSIGVGGHIQPSDINDVSQFSLHSLNWATRELNEEIDGCEILSARLVGMINDETTGVGRVHCGVMYEVILTHDQISIKSEHKTGRFMSIAECFEQYEHMESWSQIALDQLKGSTFLQEITGAHKMKSPTPENILPK